MQPAALLSLAAAGVASLAGLAHVLAPTPVALEDVRSFEGARVEVAGWVEAVAAGPRGARIDLADGTARLVVLVRGAPHLSTGDEARATGVVGRDGRSFVLSAESVERTSHAAVRSVEAVLSDLADERAFTVRGTLVRGVLREGEAGLPLSFASGPPADGPLVVTGTLRLDRGRAAFHLDVDAWTRT